MAKLVIATRRSRLALAQAELAAARLAAAAPGLVAELLPLDSAGDRHAGPIADAGGKDLFTASLRDAVRSGAADCACHSLKDVGTAGGDGLALAAFLPRADHRDAFVGRGRAGLRELAKPRIATSSPRRRAQLRRLLPAAEAVPMRGNVDTRLAKLAAGEADALLLAAAGLERLGKADAIAERLPADEFLPAPGQGTIVLEGRADGGPAASLLAAADDAEARLLATAERACAAAVGGDCHTPLGALAARRDDGQVAVRCELGGPDGFAAAAAAAADPAAAGRAAAERMLAAGGARILAQLRQEAA